MKRMLAAALGLMFVLSVNGHAESKKKKWQENHPRRAEVNKRLDNQNARIKEGVEDGKLTKQQADQLHQEDRAIRREERAMAAQNGGHITKAEQHKLNRQENRVSKQIYDEKHPAPAAPAPASGQ